MTNFEKYKKEILEIENNFGRIAMDRYKKRIRPCSELSCGDCEFCDVYCETNLFNWLYEEYQEPSVDWSKVAIDTKVLVSQEGEHWHKRYFAKYENGKVLTWLNGSTSWTADDITPMQTKPYTSWDYAKLADQNNQSGDTL